MSSDTFDPNQTRDGQEIGFLHAYLCMWKKSFVFKGRTSRGEFLKAKLVDWALFILLFASPILFDSYKYREIGNTLVVILFIYWAVSFLPSLSIVVRRYHDVNRSGWWAIALPVVIFYLAVVGFIKYRLKANGIFLGAIPNVLLCVPLLFFMHLAFSSLLGKDGSVQKRQDSF